MKYLDRFFTYIKESNQFDLDEIDSMLLPVKDMGINVIVSRQGTSGDTIFNGKYNGYKYLSISFRLDSLKSESLIVSSYESTYINDDKIWDFFDELLAFRGRLLEAGLSNDCLIRFNEIRGEHTIRLVLIGDKEDDDYRLLELSQRMKSQLNNMRTDFAYDTIVTYDDGYIMVKTSEYSYTDRKLKNLINRSLNLDSMSFDDIKVKKTKEGMDIFNKIELK